MPTPRRLVFGSVAAAYDRHRPSYPPALVTDVVSRVEVGEGRRALEVGAGTGKATAMFAAQGLRVLAVEPSGEMAQLARRNLAGESGVEIVQCDFERFDPGGERFALLYSAQAWHWIDPELRYRQAQAALVAGGLLAVFWNRVAWRPEGRLRRALATVYERVAPQLSPDSPLHPANPCPEGDEDWAAEIAGIQEFTQPEDLSYRWTAEYSSAEFTGLLGTLSEFALLDPDTRRRLLYAIAATIDEHGGTLRMPMITRAHLARAV